MSIPELVSELRVTFLTRDFDRVERALLASESRLNAEIEKKKRDIGSLQEKIEVERLERINVELELKKFKEEKLVNLKKEENGGFDLDHKGENCRHCVEMERKLDDEKGFVAELRKRNGELEGEKNELLEEKKKWVVERGAIDELRDENKRLVEEKGRAEALVESWKRKFFELNKRVSRLESGIANGKLVVDGGGNNEKKMLVIDGDESGPSKRNEDVGPSSGKSPSIPSKDGDLGASGIGYAYLDFALRNTELCRSGGMNVICKGLWIDGIVHGVL